MHGHMQLAPSRLDHESVRVQLVSQFVVTLLTPFPNDSIRVLQAQLSAFVSPKVESFVRQAWRVAQTRVLLPADVRAVSARSRVRCQLVQVWKWKFENMVKSQENRATS
jgi:hypothetical protein